MGVLAYKYMKCCLLICSSIMEKSMSNDDLKRAIEVNTIVDVIAILVTLLGIAVTLATLL